jgi:predicted negative regulator of RcsB-dependent stress response
MLVTKNQLRRLIVEEIQRLNESHFAAIGALSQKASTPEMQKALAILEQALTKAYGACGFALKNAKSMDDAKAIKGALSHALKAIEMKSDYAIHNLAIALENKPEPQPEPVAPEDAERKVESALGTQDRKRTN